MVQYGQHGSGKHYKITARCSSGSGGNFYFSEKIVNSLYKVFDGLLILAVSMNHDVTNQNVVNSWAWTGFSKLTKRIDKLWFLKGNIAIDEPSSETASYTQVKCLATISDHSKSNFPDLSGEGVLAYGWSRNFYNSDGIAAQNTLSFWNGAAEQQMSQKLRAAVENHAVTWNYQSPLQYDYQQHPIECEKPIVFYHWVDGNVSAHHQYAMMQLVFGVRFFRRRRWWRQ